MIRTRRSPGLRIVFGGGFVRVPGMGGLAWMVLQYVLGLRQLGHEVLLLERLSRADLVPEGAALARSRNADYFRDVIDAFGARPASLLLDGTNEAVALSRNEVRAWAAEADLLIDVAGGLSGLPELDSIQRRAYLDVDPGFTQLWQAVEGIDMRFDGYTDFATVGLTLSRPGSPVPSCGIDWISTPPPVVLDEWPFSTHPEQGELTTVANWRGYGSIRVGERLFGQKAHSLRRFLDLPHRTGERFALALAIDAGEPADLAALSAHGWKLLDPRAVAETPSAYRDFVGRSRAEFGIAKSGYVESRCGWFSDRSVCYLAAGRPVIAQRTGFEDRLPVGDGLFAFDSVEEIEVALAALASDYEGQRRAARRVAEEHFASEVVLPPLLERFGGSR